MKDKLFGKTLLELQAIAVENKLPKFVGSQMADWLYKKDISSIEEMLNLSKRARALLQEKYDLGINLPVDVQKSKDGTKKYLFRVRDEKAVETVMIPERERNTVCVSSQVGCKMDCDFCMTGKQGFQSNLTAGEIVSQIKSIDEANKVTNIVYMGMGEPFDNLENVLKSIEILTAEWGFAMSPRRITVSTIGIIGAMVKFLDACDAHLAISLHTPFDDERKSIMPIQVAYPIEKVIEKLHDYDLGNQRRISFEYILFEGLNDTPLHINGLVRLLRGIRCRVNLIRFHPIPNAPFKSPDEATIQYFKDQLNKKGILTTIRASRGQDIFAACGLLSTKKQ